ncbi:GTPase IMAP family member 4-like [Scomber scombrus]|uniref:GTPase IMAP family member 4-like n=1 Tax=Scomber scombrus TaxID=13677 RepID=A0AAV1QJT0_SCOSC
MKKHQEEIQRQEWEQKIHALERSVKSEPMLPTDRNLEQKRKERKKELDEWEKEQKEWWEKVNAEDAERMMKREKKLAMLQDEYATEEANYNKKLQEDPKNIKKLTDDEFMIILEDMTKKHKEEARRKAEESNDFKPKYINHAAALMMGVDVWARKQHKINSDKCIIL